ncbi:hypothetical protein BYT27DRAFT_7101537 [Phlegmacium glaucopus]|nr:hypothetical protein BYT27DRAFT_7101537 [Phlegmacium glaucopus]
MDGKHSLSATNLAVYQHLNCDLYIHNVYNGASQNTTDTGTSSPSELTKAQYKRGLDWESSLYSWLDRSKLLLKVPSMPLEASSLLENIQADDRIHFFITGLNFWPPQAKLAEMFARARTEPFNFGLAKPDLLEIKRTKDGVIGWRVLDAKASKHVKTSHHIQIYFYTLCLKYLLGHPFHHADDSAGIWLPPKDGFHTITPSFEDIKPLSISLLAPAFDTFLFEKLPRLLSQPYEQVKWHYNPLCHSCKYEPECRSRVQKEGGLGSMPNISIDDARVLKDLLRLSHVSAPFNSDENLTDIEQLHDLFANPRKLDIISRRSPALIKKSKQILAIPKKRMKRGPILSPLVEAARENAIQVIPRLNYTCPSREDIAVVISLVHDPSSPNPGGAFFYLTTHPQQPDLPSFVYGFEKELIPRLATLIRAIKTLQHTSTTQFYVWSTGEQSLLQSHIINSALLSSTNIDDIRVCIGTLAQGASLLQTTFQPLVLSGALLAFLGKGRRTKAEYQACLERMELPTEGTVEDLRKRVDNETRRLRDESTGTEDRQKELGQLQRVVILKREIERQLAMPLPGYWNLPECTSILLSSAGDCPSDEQIFMAYTKVASDSDGSLVDLLAHRNQSIYSVLQSLRVHAASPTGHSLFVNKGRELSTGFLDICTEPHLRKLFFMQQFEVLARLTDLWRSRIDGCPEAPVLEYRRARPGEGGTDHEFRLLSGAVEVPPTDRDMALYDKLLVPDTTQSSTLEGYYDNIPAEALFDDLGVSGLVFPSFDRFTKPNWLRQSPRVQREVLLADVRNILTDKSSHETLIVLRTWGTSDIQFEEGAIYRLSSRLVDFNTTKILSALFDLDLRWGSQTEDLYYDEEQTVHHNVPFLQLILDPNSFESIHMAKEYLKTENGIQKLFHDLKDLNNEIAGSLILKASQHRATQRILSNRLSVIWGPPGAYIPFLPIVQ